MRDEQSVLRAAGKRTDRNALITFFSATVVGGVIGVVAGVMMNVPGKVSVTWGALVSIVCLGVGMLRDHLSWKHFRAAYKRAEDAPDLVEQMYLVSGSNIETDKFGLVRSIGPNACGLVENVNTSRWHFVENGQIRLEPIDKKMQLLYKGWKHLTVVSRSGMEDPVVHHS